MCRTQIFRCYLRSTIQENEILLKEFLRAEAGARRARLCQRIASRVAESVQELHGKGSDAAEIAADEAAIRAAGETEKNMLEAVGAVPPW